MYRPVVTVPLVVEYEKSLCDPGTKVPFDANDIGKYLDYVCSVSDCRKVHFLWRPYLRYLKDDMVLEAAVCGQCEYIITFNLRDFRGIDKFGIVAITPGEFLRKKGKLNPSLLATDACGAPPSSAGQMTTTQCVRRAKHGVMLSSKS